MPKLNRNALSARTVPRRPRQPPSMPARPYGRVGSSLRELRAFVLAFARSYD